ncbi:hypothetical protein, partial [Carboxydothermus pertinax]|uniref:hypothetical protein n=1 Tax=Carboxydothermus pertinax TaxID=870242 RepID=UPI001F2AA846
YLGVVGAVGSNPASPTIESKSSRKWELFRLLHTGRDLSPSGKPGGFFVCARHGYRLTGKSPERRR